jgi:hypothetical protein
MKGINPGGLKPETDVFFDFFIRVHPLHPWLKGFCRCLLVLI